MGKVVEIDCEKSMKLETSRNVTKSKRSLHWCRSISIDKTCARFITVSVKKLLHYRAGGLLQYRVFYYIIGQLLHYRAFFITLSGSYYSIGRLLHYRLVQGPIGLHMFVCYCNLRLRYRVFSIYGKNSDGCDNNIVLLLVVITCAQNVLGFQ